MLLVCRLNGSIYPKTVTTTGCPFPMFVDNTAGTRFSGDCQGSIP